MLDEEDNDFVDEFNRVINDASIPDAEDYTPDTFDGYLSMEIGLTCGQDNKLQHARVKRRVVDKEWTTNRNS